MVDLVRIRARVAAGYLVAAAVDRTEPLAGWHALSTPQRTVFVSDMIMRLAERSAIPLLFAATRMTADGRIVTNFVRPTAARAECMLHEFSRFLRSELACDDQIAQV